MIENYEYGMLDFFGIFFRRCIGEMVGKRWDNRVSPWASCIFCISFRFGGQEEVVHRALKKSFLLRNNRYVIGTRRYLLNIYVKECKSTILFLVGSEK